MVVERSEKLRAYLEKTTASLAEAAARIRELEARTREPIAIVSMACRFPGGADTPEKLWELLVSEKDAVTEVPVSRWDVAQFFDADPDAAGKTYSRWGGFVEGGVENFDAAFFGISPREAAGIDPQERWLLEAAWEVFERAGIRAETLDGTAGGVYIGLSGSEYQTRAFGDTTRIDAYTLTGASPSTIVGRVAYWFGLRGPTVAVDTACSSSLVAIHMACQALRNGECPWALAGGVHALVTPEGYIALSRLKALSPTGRCRTFSAEADGFVRAEGCGLLLLKRLTDAQRDGDRIIALLRGSAINQDGRSQGLTAPNGLAQEEVIRTTLSRAAIEPSSVDVVECHGTGTRLGDPIEIEALATVYAQARPATNPLVLGSIKTNIGHTEAAAGVAGVIKAVLALAHEEIPRSLHTGAPNPYVPWNRLGVEVARERRPWPRKEHPRRVAVSSFGISGTNAHAIVEEAPSFEETATEVTQRNWSPLLLSGRDEHALRQQATRLVEHLRSHPHLRGLDVAAGLATGRVHHPARLALPVRNDAKLEDTVERLAAFSAGRAGPGLATSADARAPGKVAVLFTGQGSQRAGMGRELYARYRAFREEMDAVIGEMNRHLERRLEDILFAEPGTPNAELLNETQWAQPALFALEVALYRQWEAWGIRADVLLGHSVGELAAAHIAGILDRRDACALVIARGRLMQALPKGGAMASVEASESEVLPLLAPYGIRVSLAAINGPKQVVVSGDADAVDEVCRALRERGTRATRLVVSHAFHSAHMDPMLAAYERLARRVTYRAGQIAIVSTVTGECANSGELECADYWVGQVRRAVRFADGVRALDAIGVTAYLECGPHGVLTAMAAECLPPSRPVAFVPSLRKARAEEETLTEAACALHVQGHSLDWTRVFAGTGARKVILPTYAFQRQRYWLGETPPRETEERVTASSSPPPLDDLAELVRAEAADILRLPDPSELSPDRPLQDWGLDSLMAVELRNRLAKKCGIPLPITFVMEHPTPMDMVEYLSKQVNIPNEPREEELDDDEIRTLLMNIPAARLREAGLLAELIDLAPPLFSRVEDHEANVRPHDEPRRRGWYDLSAQDV
ncbi:acyltransferase domain-containing protein [Pendulispora brunnea]|uniref:Acyltransferase domain-containing protein n=1 Tax=Pendulispora brunnea TaxID=2905690 RepID=A0ABZ2JYE1_9BACT